MEQEQRISESNSESLNQSSKIDVRSSRGTYRAQSSNVSGAKLSQKLSERSSSGTYIAQATASLVDKTRVIEVERIDVSALPKRRFYHFVKRLFDIASCGAALILLSPVMLVIAAAVKLNSPGPVFYSQERLGKDGKPFMLYKFRSMRIDAEANGAQWASDHDPRVTRVGAFLRKSRLDEIPQFWNVVKGDMSLIGPRPEREVFYKEFEKYIHGFSQRLAVKPGITGLAQVSGGYDLKPAEKIIFDIEYIKNQSFAMDIDVILKTFGVLFTHEGAR